MLLSRHDFLPIQHNYVFLFIAVVEEEMKKLKGEVDIVSGLIVSIYCCSGRRDEEA
jgi:hypothetical protein